jgi:hypothetical protein
MAALMRSNPMANGTDQITLLYFGQDSFHASCFLYDLRNIPALVMPTMIEVHGIFWEHPSAVHAWLSCLE